MGAGRLERQPVCATDTADLDRHRAAQCHHVSDHGTGRSTVRSGFDSGCMPLADTGCARRACQREARDVSPPCLKCHHDHLHATPLHATPLHATPLHATPLHATPLHATPLHATPLHATPLHATVRCGAVRCGAGPLLNDTFCR